MMALLTAIRAELFGVKASPYLDIVCPGFDPAHPRPRSWGCKSTFMDRHICRGHENSRPDYMHRCECGRRWAE